MKKGKLWAIVVLCSFFTQQIFAYSGEINENNIEIVDTESTLEDVFIVEKIIEEQEEIIIVEDVELIGSEENNQGEYTIIEGKLHIEEDSEIQIITGEEVLEGTGSIIENTINEEEVLDFKIKFQNPSYLLDKESEKITYECDSDKDECKMNLVLTDIEGINLSSKYSCLIEYSHGFESDNRCNPTTIILTENSTITFSVFHEDNPDNVIIKALDFIKINLEDENNKVEIIDIIVDENNDNKTGSGTNLDEYINAGTGALLEEGNSGTGNIIGDDSSTNDNTYSGSINTDKGNYSGEITDIVLPEIVLTIQSGLEYSGTGNIYLCEKEDCKINLDITESFTGGILEPGFNCIWDFGSGTFSTLGTDKKCNPGYVNYGTGIHEISIIIVSEEDNSYFTGSAFFVENNISKTINNPKYNDIIESNGSGSSNGDIIDNNSESESSTNSGTIGMTGIGEVFIFRFPDININIQSGADYLNNETIKCNKEDCKINLDVRDIFSVNFPEKDYECSWDFGSGSFSSPDTINKCNPGYVDYNLGNDEILFKLSEKNNSENFITQLLYVQNNKIISQSKSSNGGGGIEYNINKKDYGKVSLEKDIIIQSGLEKKSCNSEECKINLNYDNSSYETCTWDFSDIEVLEKYKHTCNPGFIYVGEGFHNIELKVWNIKTNKYYIKKLHFYNEYIKENITGKVNFNIVMQGKELDYKKYYDDKIVCLGVEKCNINLNIETNSKNSVEYFWDFGNGEISELKNPKSVWYSSGSYELNLTIRGEDILETRKINIEVIGKNISETQVNIVTEIERVADKEKSIFTQIEKLSFHEIKFGFNKNALNIKENTIDIIGKKIKNNSWYEDKNKSIEKLKLTRNVSKQKKSLKYSGTTFPNSNIYILQGDEIIEIKSDNDGKYNLKLNNLTAGNYELEYYVLDSLGNYYESSKPKRLELNHEYVTSLSKKHKSKTINKKNIVHKTKVINNKKELKKIIHASVIPNVESNTHSLEYIFQLLLLLLSLGGGVVLLRKYKIL